MSKISIKVYAWLIGSERCPHFSTLGWKVAPPPEKLFERIHRIALMPKA